MQTLQSIWAFVLAGVPAFLALGIAIGAVGTGLEALGAWIGKTWLVALGQKLEAIGADIPKLVGKLKPPALPMLMLALTLLVPLVIFCSACGLFSSSGPLYPIAQCAPSPATLLEQVKAILLDGTGYMQKLDELGKQLGKDGLHLVVCATAEYDQELSSAKLPATAAESAARARAEAYLAARGAK